MGEMEWREREEQWVLDEGHVQRGLQPVDLFSFLCIAQVSVIFVLVRQF